MQNSLSRLEWVLSAVAALLLALIVGLFMMVHAGETMGQGIETRSGAFKAVPTPAPLTAREGYFVALPAAREWAEDAQLWQAQATWSQGSDLQAPPPAWNYKFYSPSEEATAVVNVAQTGAKLVRTRAASHEPDLVPADAWEIDSPAAYELFYETGGEAFLFIHPKHTMILTLDLGQPLRWQADVINEGALGNAAGRQMVTLLFSAEDGQLITSPVPGDDDEDA